MAVESSIMPLQAEGCIIMAEVKIKPAPDQKAKLVQLAKYTGVSPGELRVITVKIAMQKHNELMRSCAKEE